MVGPLRRRPGPARARGHGSGSPRSPRLIVMSRSDGANLGACSGASMLTSAPRHCADEVFDRRLVGAGRTRADQQRGCCERAAPPHAVPPFESLTPAVQAPCPSERIIGESARRAPPPKLAEPPCRARQPAASPRCRAAGRLSLIVYLCGAVCSARQRRGFDQTSLRSDESSPASVRAAVRCRSAAGSAEMRFG